MVMNPKIKLERAVLRDWHKRMAPFVSRYKSVDGVGVNYRESRVELEACRNLFMKAYHCSFDKGGCEFVYARRVEPFLDNSGRENRNFGAGIVSSLKNCLEGNGFRCDYPIKGTVPLFFAFGFQGVGSPDFFNSYIEMVGMTESFIDGELKRLDKIRDRHFLYVLSNERQHGPHFKRVSSASDLVGVREVYRFADDPNLDGSGLPSNSWLMGVLDEFKGEEIGIDEFVLKK